MLNLGAAHRFLFFFLYILTGGTDIIACFMGQNWTIPVYKGEVQGPILGCAIEAFDEEGKIV